MVGPNYHPPQTTMPDQFIEALEPDAKLLTDEDLSAWWKQFDDPLLDEMVGDAIKSNFDVHIAMEKILAARAQYKVESSYLFPELDVNATGTRARNSQNFFANSSPAASFLPTFQNFFQIGFDAIWELDFFGKFRRAKRASFCDIEASQEDAQYVLITVLSEVVKHYAWIRACQKKIDLTVEKIRIDETLLTLLSDLFSSGLSSQIDPTTLLATLESDRASLPPLESSLKVKIYTLATLLGQQPETLAQRFIEKGEIPVSTHKVPAGLPADLLRRRPDIKQAERQLAAATERIGVAVADLFPHITLTGNTFAGGAFIGSAYGFESAQPKSLLQHASNFFSIGPNIRWDMLDFGKTRGNIAIQTSLQRQALLKYEKIVIDSLKDVEGALIVYFEEEKRKYLIEKEVEANQKIVSLKKALLQSGLANEETVLLAQKAWIESTITLIDSTLSLTTDLISLYKALGGNWACSYSP